MPQVFSLMAPYAFRLKVGPDIFDMVSGQEILCVDAEQRDRVRKKLHDAGPLALVDMTDEKTYGIEHEPEGWKEAVREHHKNRSKELYGDLLEA